MLQHARVTGASAVAIAIVHNGVRALVLAIWAVIGLCLWVPLLVRMILVFSANVVASMFTGADLSRAQEGLHTGISFYVFGFHRINDAMNNASSPAVPEPITAHFLVRTMLELLWAIFFWFVVGLVLSGTTPRSVAQNLLNSPEPVVTEGAMLAAQPSQPEVGTLSVSLECPWRTGVVIVRHDGREVARKRFTFDASGNSRLVELPVITLPAGNIPLQFVVSTPARGVPDEHLQTSIEIVPARPRHVRLSFTERARGKRMTARVV